jgi:hypothetical protein
VESERRQGLLEAELLADDFAASLHNHSWVHFLKSSSSSSKGAANFLSWTILRATPLL